MSNIPTPRILSRAQWGARPWRSAPTRVPLSARRYFVVHYYGAGTPPREIGPFMKAIERIHMDQNGWRGAGYNFAVSEDGTIGVSHGWDTQGSHSPPHNRDGIGVMVWTQNGTPSAAALASTKWLYEEMHRKTGREPIRWYHGRDYGTECPGPALRSWVLSGMPVSVDVPIPVAPKPKPDAAKPAPIITPDPEELDVATAADLQNQIDGLRKILEARTSPHVPGDTLPDLVEDVRITKARTEAITTPDGGMDVQRGLYRTDYAYRTVIALSGEVAAMGRRLAGLSNADAAEVRRAVSDAGKALAEAADKLKAAAA